MNSVFKSLYTRSNYVAVSKTVQFTPTKTIEYNFKFNEVKRWKQSWLIFLGLDFDPEHSRDDILT